MKPENCYRAYCHLIDSQDIAVFALVSYNLGGEPDEEYEDLSKPRKVQYKSM